MSAIDEFNACYLILARERSFVFTVQSMEHDSLNFVEVFDGTCRLSIIRLASFWFFQGGHHLFSGLQS